MIEPIVKAGFLSVKQPDEALQEIAQQSPEVLLFSKTSFVKRFAETIGLSPAELMELSKTGQLDQMLSVEFAIASHVALQEFMTKLHLGEVEPETLVKASHEFAKTAQKLGNRDVQKHMLLDVNKLEELLQSDSSDADAEQRSASRE